MQILFLVAIVWIARRRRCADFVAGEFPLLLSAVLLTAWLSLFSRTQIGIRHILPALAAVVILSCAAFAGWPRFGRRRKILLGGCLVYTAASVGSYFPHLLPYFNEIVADRKMAYRYLADSNLDWGQDAFVVDEFLQKNRAVRLNPTGPVSGGVLVNANFMAGIGPAGADYWLRRLGLPPVAHVAYGHLLFQVPASAIPAGAAQPSTEVTPREAFIPAGKDQQLTLDITGMHGTGGLEIVDVLINHALDPRYACFFAYVGSVNRLVLVNDAGAAGGPFAGTIDVHGPAGSIENSQCKVSAVTLHTAADKLMLTLNVAFQPRFAGKQIVWASATNTAGASTGWQAAATWIVE